MKGWFSDQSPLVKGLTAFGAVIGALVGILTVLTHVFPSLQPPPRSGVGEASISDLEVTRNVTLGQYFHWPDMVDRGAQTQVNEEQRQILGNIITFDLEPKGFAREPVTLKWSVFEAETGRPVPDFTEKPAWLYESVQPQSDVGSKSRLEAWVPFPKSRHKSFKVAIGAYATLKGKQVLLDSKKVPINVPDKLASNQRLAQDVPPPIVQAGGPEPMPVRETKPRPMPLPP